MAATRKIRIASEFVGALAACLIFTLCLFGDAGAAYSANLKATEARIAGNDARTRIVIEFDQKPEFTVHYLENPDRIVIDLDANVDFAFPADQLAAKGLFSRIRFGAMSAGKARLVLTAQRPVDLERAEAMKNENRKGWRLVLDSAIVPQEKFAELLKARRWNAAKVSVPAVSLSPVKPSENGEFIVAVDAGHGGIDSGAVTHTRPVIREKDITLAFAKALARELNGRPGVKAFMTRDSDVFLSLGQRVQIARAHGANLFISLHADTLRQRAIRGATVYTISDKASDKLAGEIAQRENTSDEIAGVELDKEPSDVSDILIDLTRRETQAFSISLANALVKSFNGQVDLINNPHRSAGFRVLQAPDVPSVLLELGFLSNKKDVKLLTNPDFRQKVASLIADAVRRYRDKLGG